MHCQYSVCLAHRPPRVRRVGPLGVPTSQCPRRGDTRSESQLSLSVSEDFRGTHFLFVCLEMGHGTEGLPGLCSGPLLALGGEQGNVCAPWGLMALLVGRIIGSECQWHPPHRETGRALQTRGWGFSLLVLRWRNTGSEKPGDSPKGTQQPAAEMAVGPGFLLLPLGFTLSPQGPMEPSTGFRRPANCPALSDPGGCLGPMRHRRARTGTPGPGGLTASLAAVLPASLPPRVLQGCT